VRFRAPLHSYKITDVAEAGSGVGQLHPLVYRPWQKDSRNDCAIRLYNTYDLGSTTPYCHLFINFSLVIIETF
jgi:hypothetical protein